MADLSRLPKSVRNPFDPGLYDLAFLLLNSGCREWGERQHGGELTHRFVERRISITYHLLVGHRRLRTRLRQGLEKRCSCVPTLWV